MEPLVSILIPAYNAKAWIAETIRSALNQTWPRKEIIVVDDGSTDETLAIARQFTAPSVTVVTQANQGAAATRNYAFSLCHGDYLQWLDADDLLAPDKVALQMEAARQSPGRRTLYSGPWGKFFHRTQKARFTPSPLWHDLTPLEWLLRKWEDNLHMQTATWLVSRELTKLAGPWDTRLLGDDDGEYFCRVILACDGIKFVPEARVYYRQTNSGRLSYIGRSDKKMDAQFFGMQRQIGYLREMADNTRVRAACVTYLQTWLVHFYPNRMDIVKEAGRLAAELGGQLHPPELSWKYAWIEKLFGWTTTRRVQLQYNQWKSSALRAWDRAMFSLENRNPAASRPNCRGNTAGFSASWAERWPNRRS